ERIDGREGDGVQDAVDPSPPAAELAGKRVEVLLRVDVELEYVGAVGQLRRGALRQPPRTAEAREDDLRPLLLCLPRHLPRDRVLVHDSRDQELAAVERHAPSRRQRTSTRARHTSRPAPSRTDHDRSTSPTSGASGRNASTVPWTAIDAPRVTGRL